MKISSIGLGLLAAVALCGSAVAQEVDYAAGTRSLALQQTAATARAMGMGSAVVAVPQGAASLLWNPAGLGFMDCREVSIHHNSGFSGMIQETGIVGVPLGNVAEHVKNECSHGGSLGGLAASLGYVDYGSFNGTDVNGNTTGNYTAREYSGSLGWGKEVLKGLSAGVAVTANRQDLSNTSFYGYTTSLGLMWNATKTLDLGVSYNNLNLGSKLGGSLPASGFRVGTGWTIDRHILLALAGELQDNSMNRLNMGVEYLIGNLERRVNLLALRAGYVVNFPAPQLTGLTGLTLGLGYEFAKGMTFDYAFLPTGDLGISHRLSLTFKFDCPKNAHPARPAAAQTQAQAQPAEAAAVPATDEEEAAAPIVVPLAAPIVLRSVLLEDSHFDFDKSALKPDGMAALDENVQLLKDNPNTLVRVAGYTSLRGKEEYNQQLSERRAAAVEAYLVAQGIAPSRITTIGYGDTRPAEYEADKKKRNANSAAAKANMRVLFEITVK